MLRAGVPLRLPGRGGGCRALPAGGPACRGGGAAAGLGAGPVPEVRASGGVMGAGFRSP